MPKQPTNSLHLYLRDYVASAHRDAEAQNPFLTGPLTHLRYVQLMFRLELLWSQLESTALARGRLEETLGLSSDSFRRAHHLRSDLHALGVDIRLFDRREYGAETIARDWPSAIGCLYVLVGSRMGGAVIGRHIRRQISESASHALHFWHDGAGEAAVDLRRLMQALQCSPAIDSHRQAIAESAQKTFLLYAAWMRGPP